MEIYSPVLLVVSQNTEPTLRNFEVIRELKPLEFYISGPEKELAEIVKQIDWTCKLEINKDKLALPWFFSMAEEGIVVQDTSLPDSSFFFFAQAMLERYRAKKEIIVINGANPEAISKSKFSYFFSHICIGGAWATWKRAWLSYQEELESVLSEGFYRSEGEIMSLVPKNNLIEFQKIQGSTPVTPIPFPLNHQIIFDIESRYDELVGKKVKL